MMLDTIDITGPALDIVLMVLLAATMFRAVRLERALGVLRRDRASLEKLVLGFNDSTHRAEDGIERLRAAADGAGRQIARYVDQGRGLGSDLEFLIARGERIADRLEAVMSQSRLIEGSTTSVTAQKLVTEAPLSLSSSAIAADPDTRPRSQAERDLLTALRATR